jgi:hypothetical protein
VFQYVFPHTNVAYVDAVIGHNKQQDEVPGKTEKIIQCLDTLVEAVDCNNKDLESTGGTAIYKIKAENNRIELLLQSESYNKRGPSLMELSQMEFECIVELEENTRHDKTDSGPGCPSCPGCDLGPDHPLYDPHEGFIWMKMMTAVMAGAYFTGYKPDDNNLHHEWENKMEYLTKYLVDLLVLWTWS